MNEITKLKERIRNLHKTAAQLKAEQEAANPQPAIYVIDPAAEQEVAEGAAIQRDHLRSRISSTEHEAVSELDKANRRSNWHIYRAKEIGNRAKLKREAEEAGVGYIDRSARNYADLPLDPPAWFEPLNAKPHVSDPVEIQPYADIPLDELSGVITESRRVDTARVQTLQLGGDQMAALYGRAPARKKRLQDGDNVTINLNDLMGVPTQAAPELTPEQQFARMKD